MARTAEHQPCPHPREVHFGLRSRPQPAPTSQDRRRSPFQDLRSPGVHRLRQPGGGHSRPKRVSSRRAPVAHHRVYKSAHRLHVGDAVWVPWNGPASPRFWSGGRGWWMAGSFYWTTVLGSLAVCPPVAPAAWVDPSGGAAPCADGSLLARADDRMVWGCTPPTTNSSGPAQPITTSGPAGLVVEPQRMDAAPTSRLFGGRAPSRRPAARTPYATAGNGAAWIL